MGHGKEGMLKHQCHEGTYCLGPRDESQPLGTCFRQPFLSLHGAFRRAPHHSPVSLARKMRPVRPPSMPLPKADPAPAGTSAQRRFKGSKIVA